MSKITLSPVANLIDATTAKNTINSNSAIIQAAIDNTLSRDGTNPNTMGASLDMNSNQILNLPTPMTANSPLRLQDLNNFIGGGTVTNIPAGGTVGQVLTKHSNTDYDVDWEAGGGGGGSITLTGDVTGSGTGSVATTLATVAAGATVGSASAIPVITFNNKGLVTSASTTPVTAVTNANLTGPITSVGNATSVASQTGTGSTFVMNTSPTLVTPLLGTPTSGVLTNCTGTAAGLTAGTVTTNANLTGDVTSSGNATTLATVASGSTVGSSSLIPVITFNNKGLVTSVTTAANTPSPGNLTGDVTSVGLATTYAGNLPTSKLNSGTSASSSTFWRGDGTWASPAGGNITIGSSVISGGTNTRVLFNNSGVVGEYALTGTGSNVMSSSAHMQTLHVDDGTLFVDGVASPTLLFNPSTGATKTGQFVQSGDTWSVGANGIGQYLLIDLNSGFVGIGKTPATMLDVNGPMATKVATTVTASTYTVLSTDSGVVGNNTTVTITLTLPTASSFPGRWLYVTTITAHAIVSASSNVLLRTSTTPGVTLLTATAGAWALLQSDGSNWRVMAGT